MVADRELEIDVLEEITETNGNGRVRRQQAAYAPSKRRSAAAGPSNESAIMPFI